MTRLLRAACPGCQKELRIPGQWTAATLRCKGCGQVLRTRPGAPAKTHPDRRPARASRAWRQALAAVCVLGGLTVAATAASGLPSKETAADKAAPTSAKADARKGKRLAAGANDPNKAAPAAVAPLAAGAKLDATALAGRIDQYIDHRLAAEKVPASPRADDAEFLRRVALDITGVIPTADRAAAFLDDKDPGKRAKLIDELLASEPYGKHMADIWQNLLLPRTSDNRRINPQAFTMWLEENFRGNKPWDKFVGDLLTASGTLDKNGAVAFFLANPTADKINDQVSRLFLGIQLQCAQCHNHPFTGWQQTEYWAMAAFFSKVRPDNVRGANKQNTSPGVAEGAAPGGRNRLPESAKIVPAKFLQGAEPKLDPKAPFRPVFSEWLTTAENPYFSRALVNRTWQQFFGRGFVTPVDDIHDGNPASHPELFKELAGQFAVNGFDLKDLIRAICNSQTYQRTSKPTGDNSDDVVLFSHVAVKPLTPEQLFDSLVAVTGLAAPAGARNRAPANQRGGANTPRTQFVAFFQADEGADPTEYQAGIPQALRLMNSDQFLRTARTTAAKTGTTPEQAVETLYLKTLSRRPTGDESRRLIEYVKTHDAGQAYNDLLWALLNSSEFTLNH